MSTKIY